MFIVFFIHCVVLLRILFRVSVVGADGLMKSVSLVACFSIPGGNVLVVRAMVMMCLWWMA